MTEKNDRSGGVASAKACPVCGKPAVAALRPFCSRRCADVDLSRWLTGAYAIPVRDADEDEDGERAGPPSDNEPGGRGR